MEKKRNLGRKEFKHPTEWTKALFQVVMDLIDKQGLDQTKVCEQAGLSKNFITKIKRGEKKMLSLDEVEPIAQVLRVPTLEICTLAHEKKTLKLPNNGGARIGLAT